MKIKNIKELINRQDLLSLIFSIPLEAQEDTRKILAKENATLKSEISHKDMSESIAKFLKDFEKNNTTILFEEDYKSQAVGLLAYCEDSQEIADKLGIENNFIMFQKAITAPEHRNSGVLKKLATEALQSKDDKIIIACCSCKKAISQEGVEFDHVMNLDRYGFMMQLISPSPVLQLRDVSQNGSKVFPLKDFMDKSLIHKEKLQNIIDQESPMGFYVRSR